MLNCVTAVSMELPKGGSQTNWREPAQYQVAPRFFEVCGSRKKEMLHRPQATLIGYVLAFRWVLIDQRRRCPVCLQLLINPIRIGQPSHIMLDWYGTELMCSKGHGLMHVPETPTSSYSTQTLASPRLVLAESFLLTWHRARPARSIR